MPRAKNPIPQQPTESEPFHEIDAISIYSNIPSSNSLTLAQEVLAAGSSNNDTVINLYSRIKETEYDDPSLQSRKLNILSEVFREICYNDVKIPTENVKKAKKSFLISSHFTEPHQTNFTICSLYQRGESECQMN